METLVPTIRTTPTKRDFALAVLLAWPEATKISAGILYAHFAGETGDGLHCYGWNFGNVKWTPGCGYDYQVLKGTTECVDSDEPTDLDTGVCPPGQELVQVDKNASRFRVYPSMKEGMEDFINSKRYGQWRSTWPYVLAGDPVGYATELKQHRYYTISLEVYISSMRMKLNEWMKTMYFEAATAIVESGAHQSIFPVASENNPTVHSMNYPGLPGFESEDLDEEDDKS